MTIARCSHGDELPQILIVPTLRVVTQPLTLRVFYAERQPHYSHARHGSDHIFNRSQNPT